MANEFCAVFNRCYPHLRMSDERFASLFPRGKFCEYKKDGKLLGFAVSEGNAIRMICVLPDFQRQGIGTKLLAEAEADVAAGGYKKAIVGGTSSRLFIGADAKSWGFFEKNGYRAHDGCDEMLMVLKNYPAVDYPFRGHECATFGWFDGEIDEIRAAVAQVEDDWTQYFTDPKHIYVARVDGEIASFCLVDCNCRNYLSDAYGKVGMPGCVGTVPKFRNRGIGIEMVANATQYLKEQGMDVSFIFYTGVADWYEKIGYRTFLSEIFCEKELS